jgi:AraC-like DNA-binding protein
VHDPLAAFVGLLRPRAAGAKLITGAGAWGVCYGAVNSAGFGLILKGACQLALAGNAAVDLAEGDFVLMPPNPGFAIFSDPDAPRALLAAESSAGLAALHHGEPGEPSFKLLGGYFQCDPANADLLAGLLPSLLHIRRSAAAAKRLSAIIDLIAEEAAHDRPGRDLVIERLVETLLVEALRVRSTKALPRPGVLEALADPSLARALRALHADIARRWTVAELAREAGLSRSAFSERFAAKVGAPPMDYLIRWRFAVAKDLLRRNAPPLEQVAAAIGYGSASAFSTAFRKATGAPPGRYARTAAA